MVSKKWEHRRLNKILDHKGFYKSPDGTMYIRITRRCDKFIVSKFLTDKLNKENELDDIEKMGT